MISFVRLLRSSSSRLVAGVAVLATAGAATACGRGEAVRAADAARAPEVAVVTVHPEPVSITSDWLATLDGYVNAQIRPQVSGYLLKRDYREGAFVHKGEVLFEIDPRTFQTALAEAQAKLAQAQAQLSKANRDVQRDTPLAAQKAVAQSQLDDDVEAKSAAEAAVKSAAATVDAAQLNLEFTNVTSLVDGVAAIATAQIGDLVNPNTLLTTVSQVDPIKAYFPLNEREYLSVAKQINRGGSRLWTGDSGLTLLLSDGTVYPAKGRFLAADRDIDSRTGTIRVSATFPNPDHLLRPGQGARVRAATQTLPDALVVPQRAVNQIQGTNQVRVVGPDNKVSLRNVTVGPRIDNRWVIQQGLAAGDRVVVEGPATRDGTVVSPKPYTPAAGER